MAACARQVLTARTQIWLKHLQAAHPSLVDPAMRGVGLARMCYDDVLEEHFPSDVSLAPLTDSLEVSNGVEALDGSEAAEEAVEEAEGDCGTEDAPLAGADDSNDTEAPGVGTAERSTFDPAVDERHRREWLTVRRLEGSMVNTPFARNILAAITAQAPPLDARLRRRPRAHRAPTGTGVPLAGPGPPAEVAGTGPGRCAVALVRDRARWAGAPPALGLLAQARFAEGTLEATSHLSFHVAESRRAPGRERRPPAGISPVLLCLDTSGSMAGAHGLYARAVARLITRAVVGAGRPLRVRAALGMRGRGGRICGYCVCAAPDRGLALVSGAGAHGSFPRAMAGVCLWRLGREPPPRRAHLARRGPLARRRRAAPNALRGRHRHWRSPARVPA